MPADDRPVTPSSTAVLEDILRVKHATVVDTLIHPYTLRFDDSPDGKYTAGELEHEFNRYFNKRFSRGVRITYMISCLFSLILLILQASRPDTPSFGSILAMIIIFNVLTALALGVSYHQRTAGFFVENFSTVSALLTLLAAIFTLQYSAIDGTIQEGTTVTLIIVILSAGMIFLRLRYVYVLFDCWVVALYFMLYSFSIEEFSTEREFQEAGFNSFLMIVVAVLYSYGAWSSETFVRRNFLHATRLADDNKSLAHRIRLMEAQEQNRRDKVDLSAPMERIFRTLDRLKDRRDFDDSDKDAIDEIKTTLISNDSVYAPNIARQLDGVGVNSEIQSWLLSEIASNDARRGSQKAAARRFSQQQRASVATCSSANHPDADPSAYVILPTLTPDEEKELTSILHTVSEWNFDVFRLNEVTKGRPLFFLTYYLFRRHNLFENFKIDDKVCRTFLAEIEQGYVANPYHNSTHAADVVHGVYYMMTRPNPHVQFDELDLLVAILAAMMHDYAHPGLNNTFQIATLSDMAVTYNDRSILENYHVSTAFRLLLSKPDHLLSSLSAADFKHVRHAIIQVVLATDLANHFEYLGQFKTKSSVDGVNWNDRENKLLLLQMIVKVADVSNVAKDTTLYHRWLDNIMEEWYLQGEREELAGLPISSFMDRKKPSIPQSQIGFIDFLVKPLYSTFVAEFLQLPSALKQLEINRSEWDTEQS